MTTSPQAYARTGGALYLVIIVAGLFAEAYVRGNLIVPTDAAATAANLLSSESLFRAGFAAELFGLACDVAVAMILYVLLRPVDRNVALLTAFLRLTADTIYGLNGLTELAALRLIDGSAFLGSFSPDQRHALALLALKLHGDGYAISLVFFGFGCVLLGHLIAKAGYLPKALGLLMWVAGLCYVANSFVRFLAPPLAAAMFPWILVPCFIGEASLCLWLLVKGVDIAKWRERAMAPSPAR